MSRPWICENLRTSPDIFRTSTFSPSAASRDVRQTLRAARTLRLTLQKGRPAGARTIVLLQDVAHTSATSTIAQKAAFALNFFLFNRATDVHDHASAVHQTALRRLHKRNFLTRLGVHYPLDHILLRCSACAGRSRRWLMLPLLALRLGQGIIVPNTEPQLSWQRADVAIIPGAGAAINSRTRDICLYI